MQAGLDNHPPISDRKGGGGSSHLRKTWFNPLVAVLLSPSAAWVLHSSTESVSSIKANMTELMVQFSGEFEEIPPLIDSCSCRQQRTHTLTLTRAPLLLMWKVEYRYRYFYDFCVSEGFFKTQWTFVLSALLWKSGHILPAYKYKYASQPKHIHFFVLCCEWLDFSESKVKPCVKVSHWNDICSSKSNTI